jgi:hypothetical protein
MLVWAYLHGADKGQELLTDYGEAYWENTNNIRDKKELYFKRSSETQTHYVECQHHHNNSANERNNAEENCGVKVRIVTQEDDDDVSIAESNTRQESLRPSQPCVFQSGCRSTWHNQEDDCRKHGTYDANATVGEQDFEDANEGVFRACEEHEQGASQTHRVSSSDAVSGPDMVDEAEHILRQDILCVLGAETVYMPAKPSTSEPERDYAMHDADSSQDIRMPDLRPNDDIVSEDDCQQTRAKPDTSEEKTQTQGNVETNSFQGSIGVDAGHVIDGQTCESPKCASGKRRCDDTSREPGTAGASCAQEAEDLHKAHQDTCSKRARACETVDAAVAHSECINTSEEDCGAYSTEALSYKPPTGLAPAKLTRTSQASSSSSDFDSNPHSLKHGSYIDTQQKDMSSAVDADMPRTEPAAPSAALPVTNYQHLAYLAKTRQTLLQTLDDFEREGLVQQSGECMFEHKFAIVYKTCQYNQPSSVPHCLQVFYHDQCILRDFDHVGEYLDT